MITPPILLNPLPTPGTLLRNFTHRRLTTPFLLSLPPPRFIRFSGFLQIDVGDTCSSGQRARGRHI